ncbi:hypothetical protein F4810DRAFT_669570, partial [Camillea tinctor]
MLQDAVTYVCLVFVLSCIIPPLNLPTYFICMCNGKEHKGRAREEKEKEQEEEDKFNGKEKEKNKFPRSKGECYNELFADEIRFGKPSPSSIMEERREGRDSGSENGKRGGRGVGTREAFNSLLIARGKTRTSSFDIM